MSAVGQGNVDRFNDPWVITQGNLGMNNVEYTDSSIFTQGCYSYTTYKIRYGVSFTQRSIIHDTRESQGNIYAGERVGPSFSEPYLIGGNITYYSRERYSRVSGLEMGHELERQRYNIMSNRLDGIHYTDKLIQDGYNGDERSYKWESRFDHFVVINGHIVDATDNIMNKPRDLETIAESIIDKYRNWLMIGLNVNIVSVSHLPFPLPVVHKDEDLYYDLELMVNIFLEDFRNHVMEYDRNEFLNGDMDSTEWGNLGLAHRSSGIHPLPKNNVHCVFEKLEDGVIAKSYGKDADENIIIKVDPNAWLNASTPNKWYILYHELGHDVLNLSHGQGGRMMFNYPTKNYSWEDFFNDRGNMFLYVIHKSNPNDENSESSLRWSNY